MNAFVDTEKPIPAYLQIYRTLVEDISTGVYPYGTRLPSKRVIAEDTGTSVITVEHAIKLLCEEGYTKSRERSGVYVIYKGSDFWGRTAVREEELREGTAVRTEEVSSYIGEFSFSILAKIVRKVLLDYSEQLLVKSPNQGCMRLREEICRYLARSRGIRIEPEQVVVGSGAEYLYGLVAQFLGPGHTVAVEEPSYDKIRKVYESMGLTCDGLTMRFNGISSEELQATGAEVLHVTPFNSFPSGVTADISKKREYLAWARERGGIIIEDNFDSELTVSRKPEEPLFSMASGADVIYLNTFSRTLAPSMRIGYMILPASLVGRFQERLGFYSCTVPSLEQYVIAELLSSGEFERHINRIRRRLRAAAE